MSETKERNENSFVAYEYSTITVKRDIEPLYSDCYRNFGWIPMENREISMIDADRVALRFKRDRKIKNRMEVHALQRKC